MQELRDSSLSFRSIATQAVFVLLAVAENQGSEQTFIYGRDFL